MPETFQLQVVTPGRIFFEGEADFVEIKTGEGRVGIYAGHEPTTVLLDPGVLLIRSGTEVKKAALHTGFAEILPEKISIVAEIAEWPDEIDKNRAEEARIRAKRKLETGEERSILQAELALRKALARLEALK
ncbi:MAG: ATP synthase F1 subunit epsilon [Lachnospiraceae bacterium]|nr:ATP synthase F1 subunit epsilon [Candidatus Fimimorpha excrementavium]